MKNILITVPSFSTHRVSTSKLLRESDFNLIIKNNTEHLPKSEPTMLRESVCTVITGKDGCQMGTLSLLPGARIMLRFRTGIDNIDPRAIQRSDIAINNVAGINSDVIAEFITGFIFVSIRNILDSYHAMQDGYWGKSYGCELQGKRIGLVGYGNVGKAPTERLPSFNVELPAFDE